ncbi:MAG TPA: carnitine dehydratase, partial [Oceanospirillaceae bacterium]|nr:carnitine dehydratase [Oceanospirillaceae bacterium]
MQTYGNRINNQQVMPTDDRWLQTSSPYTGEVWARVPDSPAAVDTAVAAARKAFDEG